MRVTIVAGTQALDQHTTPRDCHPEAFFWAKDLPRCIGLERRVPVLSRGCWPKSQYPASTLEASWEVLLPKEGLRMTVFRVLSVWNHYFRSKSLINA